VEHFDIGPLHNFPEKVIERLQNVKKDFLDARTVKNTSLSLKWAKARLRLAQLSHSPGVRLNVRFHRVKRGHRLYPTEGSFDR